MNDWKFLVRDLRTLWLEAIPCMLGEIWQNDEEDRLRTDDTFCRNKIQSYCVFSLPETMPIRIIDGNHYDPFVTPEGLFMALPERPSSMEEVFRNYILQSRFFYLPGSRTNITPAASVAATSELKPPTFQKVEDSKRWVLTVTEVQKIVATIPKLVAMDWLEPNQIPIQNLDNKQSVLERNLEVSLDGFFSKDGAVTFTPITDFDAEPYLTPKGLTYPIPDRPNDLKEIFESYRSGVATNPASTITPILSWTA